MTAPRPVNNQNIFFPHTHMFSVKPVTSKTATISICHLLSPVCQQELSTSVIYLMSVNNNPQYLSSPGVVTVAASVNGHRDRQYVLKVTARDRGDPPRSTDMDVRIKVAEVNRNAPQFLGPNSAYRVTVSESTGVQSVIARVRTVLLQDLGIKQLFRKVYGISIVKFILKYRYMYLEMLLKML